MTRGKGGGFFVILMGGTVDRLSLGVIIRLIVLIVDIVVLFFLRIDFLFVCVCVLFVGVVFLFLEVVKVTVLLVVFWI
jgi:hypothetical protein